MCNSEGVAVSAQELAAAAAAGSLAMLAGGVLLGRTVFAKKQPEAIGGHYGRVEEA